MAKWYRRRHGSCLNAFIERKNGSIRRELLNGYLFYNLAEVRKMSEKWRIDYNTERPHKSLGYVPPIEYAKMNNQASALSTPASGNNLKIEAQPVVDKAVKIKRTKFENSN